MFTVILYDQKMNEFLKEYMSFIQPFASRNDFALCRWNPAGTTINEAMPDLYDIVGERKEWRAIVLHHLFKDASENPYDFFKGDESAEEIEKNDLIRLTHMLSVIPRKVTITQKEEDVAETFYKFNKKVSYSVEDNDKPYYKDNIADYYLECYRPVQITLVATRKIVDGKNYFSQERGNLSGQVESLFWDRNDYPSNVRFVVYDLHARGDKISRKDVFELVNAILVLAVNDMFVLKMEAYKFYKMSVEIEKAVLEKMLEEFQNDMYNIASEINKFRVLLASSKVKEQLPGELPKLDEEYEIQFPAQEASEMMASYHGYGLAKDCPTLDIKKWKHEMDISDEAFENFKKQPLRCLKRSINEYREIEKIKNKPVKGMFDEYQLEDLKEKMETLEREMFDLEIGSSLDYANENKLRNSFKKAVQTYMGIRMPKSEMIVAGLFALLVYLAGFIPYIITTARNKEALGQVVLIVAVSMGVLILCGLFAMWLKLRGLIHLIANYNGQINKIIELSKVNQERFKQYVTKAFNYRKYWFFANEIAKGRDREALDRGIPTNRMLKFHMAAVEEALELIGKICHVYEIDSCKFEQTDSEHKYNLQVMPDQTGYYRLPIAKRGTVAEYNGTGIKIATTYDYVLRFNLKKEELYDK